MKEHTIASRIVATCCAAAVACAAAICALTTRDAVAAPTDSASGSIAITYQHKSNDGADSNAGGASDSGAAGTGDFAIPGATFRLYKVGQVSSGANFEPVAPFTDSTAYPIDWSKVTGYDAQVYRDVANTLAGLIAANGASESAAVDSGETDKAGRLTFAGVEDGLYLVVSDSVKVEGAAGAAAVGGTADEDSYWQCASANMLVAMPQDGVSNGSRELAIEPKTECSTQLKPTLERTVRKVWNDRNDSDGKRPESITVKLLRDGVVFEEVKLNESNKWAHSWTGLSSAHQWAVVEASVPSGYTTLSDVEGDTTTITNTHTPPETPPAHTGSAVQSVAWMAATICAAALVLLGVVRIARKREGKQ